MITKRVVRGTYKTIEGIPRQGYIEFTPSTHVYKIGYAIVPLSMVRADLDKDGFFSVDLAVTDDPLWVPDDWVWILDEKMDAGKIWELTVPTSGSPLDITPVYPPD